MKTSFFLAAAGVASAQYMYGRPASAATPYYRGTTSPYSLARGQYAQQAVVQQSAPVRQQQVVVQQRAAPSEVGPNIPGTGRSNDMMRNMLPLLALGSKNSGKSDTDTDTLMMLLMTAGAGQTAPHGNKPGNWDPKSETGPDIGASNLMMPLLMSQLIGGDDEDADDDSWDDLVLFMMMDGMLGPGGDQGMMGFGNMIPYMLMSEGNDESDGDLDSIAMMMMMNGPSFTNGAGGMGSFLPLLMMKDSKSDTSRSDIPLLFFMMTMGQY